VFLLSFLSFQRFILAPPEFSIQGKVSDASLSQLAVITQGIAARSAQGNASSAKAATYAKLFPVLGKLSVNHIEDYAGGKEDGGRAKL
jgi:hypothetical protein